jgi:hypothetical protein
MSKQKESEEQKQKLKEAELLLRCKQAFQDANLFKQATLKAYPIAKILGEL